MNRFFFLILSFSFLHGIASAQFAPQAGITGSTAISATDVGIKAWATQCTVQRGYVDIANKALGNTSAFDSSMALGVADHNIVCLGDSGIAVLTLSSPIFDGPGADFAVFENGFKDPADPAMAFLELAFVEVSSDGIFYKRFPATSNTPLNTQIPGSGTYMDATLINNLAGKYVSMFGTPFDLAELAGTPGLDINNVTHIRLVDVIGSVFANSCVDNSGHIINDPYPTNFPTGGFDLDALGIMHQVDHSSVGTFDGGSLVSVYPNPASDKVVVTLNSNYGGEGSATLVTVTGAVVATQPIAAGANNIDIASYPSGIYYLTLSSTNGSKWVGKIVKY